MAKTEYYGLPQKPLKIRFLRAIKQYWLLYLMLVPAVIYFTVYKYAPMGGLVIAFKNYKVRSGIFGSEWIDPWYHWFEYFFKSPAAMQIISNTLILSFSKLAVGMFPPLIFALAVSECKAKLFTRFIQTVSYLPHFLSWVVVYGICVAMFSQTTGVVNTVIAQMGMDKIPFLTSNDYFRGVLIGTDLWKGLGWGAIIYLAAIMGIDTSLYEAATIDGCGRFKQIWYVTLPSIRKIFIVLLIMNVGKVLDAGFSQVYVFMTDQVKATGEIIDTWVYTQGLGKMNYSLSTAVGLIKSLLSFIMVYGTNALARKWESAIW